MSSPSDHDDDNVLLEEEFYETMQAADEDDEVVEEVDTSVPFPMTPMLLMAWPMMAANRRRHMYRRNRRDSSQGQYPPIPSVEGRKLMTDGTFGLSDKEPQSACGHRFPDSTIRKRRMLARRLFDREMAISNRGRQKYLGNLAVQNLIPSTRADLIIGLGSRAYSGQFSDDGSFFFSCGQDFKVRMYDTSNPYDWKYYKTAHYYGGQWTITDASLSPNNDLLAYSSIRSRVCLAKTDPEDTSDPTSLNFDMRPSNRRDIYSRQGMFGIWSLRFSGSGTEIVAGASNHCVYVYDLPTQRSTLRIKAHSNEVNAVCYGDKGSPDILYSGSDDTTLKVWDRRSLSSMRPAGMFLGHTEGVTYIDSKGDGRYVISNAKDQTCKLWDLRKMVSTDIGEKVDNTLFQTNFDYRYESYDEWRHVPHPCDCSVVTFRGHSVLNTLIRCHFSPASVNGRYVYSGSNDGKVYIWNMDGTAAAEPINVLAATHSGGNKPSRDDEEIHYEKTIIRDCAWHPFAPVIAATSWNDWENGQGTCTVHSWGGNPKTAMVDEKLQALPTPRRT
ncbi:WD40 repeat-like protein [Piedraia hortae CBS 480.64]|uniref:WD40 repeat-like protein n=1 Tax=Piedraia hortae CBS 480.64 TaxID=1314780 RepID=A0A6A7C3K8_9PEZI|nr:WD40 repeat-like protein [Piedraia hortae CBS 480.64]